MTESLTIARGLGQDGTPQLAGALEARAALAAVQGTPDRALRLAGAAAALRARLHQPVAVSEQATVARRLTPARQALSAEEQATAWSAGQAMTYEQAIAEALDELPAPLVTPPSPAGVPTYDARREQARSRKTSTPPSTGSAKDGLPRPPLRQGGRPETVAVPRRSRPERQAWALQHLRTAGPLTPQGYARALAVSVDTALADLRELMAQGLVRAEGTTKDRKYRL